MGYDGSHKESDTTEQLILSFSVFIKITWVFWGAGAVLSA